MKNLQSTKSLLAKLMASENITVSHQSVQTAYFDLNSRTLVCPIWQDMDGDMYDLLMGHEVGHALETPKQGWHDALVDENGQRVSKKFKDFLNVLEDARIEKKIKDFQSLFQMPTSHSMNAISLRFATWTSKNSISSIASISIANLVRTCMFPGKVIGSVTLFVKLVSWRLGNRLLNLPRKSSSM